MKVIGDHDKHLKERRFRRDLYWHATAQAWGASCPTAGKAEQCVRHSIFEATFQGAALNIVPSCSRLK